MKKAKVTVTITRIINLDPDIFNYLENATPEAMLAEEIRYAEDFPHDWMEENNVQWKTTGEIIEENSDPTESA